MMNRNFISVWGAITAALALAACDSSSGQRLEPEPGPDDEVPLPQPPSCASELSHAGGTNLEWDARIVAYEGASLGPTSGSPIRMDLNADGCPDFVFGAASDEFRTVDANGRDVKVPNGLGYAIDGASGELLWSVTAQGELFALPVSLERSNGEKAVVFGGRLAALIAVESQSGTPIWTFDPSRGTVWGYPLNFFNPIVIADQDGDGTEDLFVAFGGYDLAEAGAPRPASYFGLISGETGQWITRRRTPDLAETYMSPVLRSSGGADKSEWKFLVGTGGETLVGGLWEISLADLYELDTGETYGRRLIPGTDEKGIISPPTVGEFREKGKMDVLASMFGGKVVLLDGDTDEIVWEVESAGEELMSVPTPVQLSPNEWGVAIYSLVGEYPEYEEGVLRVYRAEDGELMHELSHDSRLAGSPVSAKISSTECDDILWGTTHFEFSTLYHWRCLDEGLNHVQFDLGTLATPLLVPRAAGGIDLAWLGTDTSSPQEPDHDWEVIEEDPAYPMHFFTLSLTDSEEAEITWGAYMGDGSGVFRRR